MKTPAGGKAGAKAGAKATGKPGGIEGMFVNKMIDSLRPHVPEYANVVMAELGKAQTQKASGIRSAECWPRRSRTRSATRT